jgi:hypothetical protein
MTLIMPGCSDGTSYRQKQFQTLSKSQWRRTYHETTNYAVAESSMNPGSTYKLADLMPMILKMRYRYKYSLW